MTHPPSPFEQNPATPQDAEKVTHPAVAQVLVQIANDVHHLLGMLALIATAATISMVIHVATDISHGLWTLAGFDSLGVLVFAAWAIGAARRRAAYPGIVAGREADRG